ncbi:Hsp70 family protein [Telmatospirillum sp.]|uniref:Hsp70 family protein n=1 Tax=Telmatospirillum sp. TaxID=2079197 RepID=UPI002846F1E6|nr:Hsp70 family protein [Telmatospirillum sp.]MDR3436936.1 Hsp70 family protein [Telmatospirillum sp.]
MMFVGIDFGTTNSAVSLIGDDGSAKIVSMPPASDNAGADMPRADTLRSILAFSPEHRDKARRLIPRVGQEAVDAYLFGDGDCRLLQSFKSYLTSRLFTSASIFNTPYSLEAMIALVVGRLRKAAEAEGGASVSRVVAGRPVRFVADDGQTEDDFALARLRQAFATAGIADVAFEYEPIAAAYYYERGLGHDETVLVADFGGGTSDFCLVRLGPERSKLASPQDAIIGTSGVGNAGDALDRRIVEMGIAPFFGKDVTYRSAGKDLPVPSWIFGKFARWHHIDFLDTQSTRRMLRDIQRHADHPELIDQLLALIEHNLGYLLYRAVEQVKRDLSAKEETTFVFNHHPISITRTIRRAEFESWITPELTEIEGCVEGLLQSTGLPATKVDRVFMTGGSSLVPAVRRIFTRRFGADRVSSGGEFVSVANGLAYRARELFSDR